MRWYHIIILHPSRRSFFTNEQRRATVEAGELAGLMVERIINEPTAAALSYGIDHMEENQHILVYDLGGGTLDITVLEMFDGILEVKASSGNNQLGGKDFDQRLIEYLQSRCEEQYGVRFDDHLRVLARMKDAAEACKIALSHQESFQISLPFLWEKNGQPISLEETITRNTFEELIGDLVESTWEPIQNALKDAKLQVEDLDMILLVGGSTRVPLITKFLKRVLKQEPATLVDPDLAVVAGAAIQAGILNEELQADRDILITDVCPYTLGVEVLGDMGGITIPDMYDPIITRNSTIPVVQEKIYGTAMDGQKEVEIKVFQGDYEKASLNHFLGRFKLSGIPPAPAFQEKIKVKFRYDVNGILQVEAEVLSTRQQAQIAIETAGVKMQQEVDVTEWKEAAKSKSYRSLIRKAEKFLEEIEESSELYAELDALIKDLKRALVLNEEDEVLEEIQEQLVDFLYDMEEFE